jgi:4-hydroxybenzoate polyprenyltransferase
LLAVETFYLLHLPSSLNWYLLLLFLCTLFVYSLHYLVKSRTPKTDTRLEWCRRNRPLLIFLIVLSFVLIAGGVYWHFKSIFLHHGRFNYRNFTWFIIIPLIALSYSYPISPWSRKSLRQIGWLKMLSLSFTWSFATVVLPVLMWPDENITGSIQLIVLFFQRFFFIATLSILFNVRDYEEDKKDEVRTIAVIAGPETTLLYSKWIMTAVNLLACLLLVYQFDLWQPEFMAAVFIPALILFLSMQHFYTGGDEARFVFLYDGLMILKALLLIFAVLITPS